MQKYWLRSSKSLEKGMNRFLSTRRLLCIFDTRLSFILMKLQTHQVPLGPVFMTLYKHTVLRRQYANILFAKLKIIRKSYESFFFLSRRLLCSFSTRLSFILMNQKTHQCSLQPVFMVWAKTYSFEKALCENIGCEAQNDYEKVRTDSS